MYWSLLGVKGLMLAAQGGGGGGYSGILVTGMCE